MCSVFILGPKPLNIYVLLLFAYDYKSINSEGEIVCMWTINRVASREEKKLCMDEHKTHREHLIHTSLFLCVECCQQKPKKNQFRIDNNSQPNNFLYVAKHLNGQEKVRFETKQCEFVSCLRCDWMWSAIGITCMDNKQKTKNGDQEVNVNVEIQWIRKYEVTFSSFSVQNRAFQISLSHSCDSA